jgi:hypothetical protein
MPRLLAGLAGVLAGAVMAAVDVDALWDFGDPAASEQRFRAALDAAQGDDRLVLRTQIARTYSLRGRFAEAEAELDAIAPALAAAGAEPRVRALLELGRSRRSAGRPDEALPLFRQAFELADGARLEALAADALHMVALAVQPLDERLDGHRRTAEYARAAADPRARRWEGPALNNLGSDLRDAGRLDESLAAFEAAQAVFDRLGGPLQRRIARWQVANLLRLRGQADEALAMQLALERDSAAAGAPDRYVFEELALLYAARGDAGRAAHYRALQAAPPDTAAASSTATATAAPPPPAAAGAASTEESR